MNTNKMLQNWNNIKGGMRLLIRCNESEKGKLFATYSTSIGKKNEKGGYDNVYFDVQFKKNCAPDKTSKAVNELCYIEFIKNKAKYTNWEICVLSGFLTVKTYKDGIARPAVMVMDYECLPADEVEKAQDDNIPF